MDFSHVRQLSEGSCVAKGNEGDAVVGKGGHGRNSGGFLSTAETTSRDEHASELAVQFALLPEVTGRIPKRLQKKKGKRYQPKLRHGPKTEEKRRRAMCSPSTARGSCRIGWEYREGRHQSWPVLRG